MATHDPIEPKLQLFIVETVEEVLKKQDIPALIENRIVQEKLDDRVEQEVSRQIESRQIETQIKRLAEEEAEKRRLSLVNLFKKYWVVGVTVAGLLGVTKILDSTIFKDAIRAWFHRLLVGAQYDNRINQIPLLAETMIHEQRGRLFDFVELIRVSTWSDPDRESVARLVSLRRRFEGFQTSLKASSIATFDDASAQGNRSFDALLKEYQIYTDALLDFDHASKAAKEHKLGYFNQVLTHLDRLHPDVIDISTNSVAMTSALATNDLRALWIPVMFRMQVYASLSVANIRDGEKEKDASEFLGNVERISSAIRSASKDPAGFAVAKTIALAGTIYSKFGDWQFEDSDNLTNRIEWFEFTFKAIQKYDEALSLAKGNRYIIAVCQNNRADKVLKIAWRIQFPEKGRTAFTPDLSRLQKLAPEFSAAASGTFRSGDAFYRCLDRLHDQLGAYVTEVPTLQITRSEIRIAQLRIVHENSLHLSDEERQAKRQRLGAPIDLDEVREIGARIGLSGDTLKGEEVLRWANIARTNAALFKGNPFSQ